ncbi:MAG: hypothetical protein A2V87_08570 [Deltaproteobacteria bacterium RBG_16_58_17]|nr:MAG: hypothetical protein A2V87_08570 [Deltaproteobacteria bacterium RBG_16_58_17]
MTDNKKKTITPREFAEIYGFAEGTLANLRYHKRGPRYFQVGRKVLYFVEDVERWIRRCPVLTIDSISEEK